MKLVKGVDLEKTITGLSYKPFNTKPGLYSFLKEFGVNVD